MNVFYVHPDPEIAAQSLCDQHIVCMAKEAAQILSTVAIANGMAAPYKATHQHVSIVRWAGSSKPAGRWVWTHGMAICREYTKRYGKTHACEQILSQLQSVPDALPDIAFQPPPAVVSEELKSLEVLAAYRAFYRTKTFARYRHSQKPQWLD